ncbi:MarR family winged helix-turn-helix transcriptional regulator [Mucilaginibacter agri]|uniref:Winged helix DNA-binding protein n=1 Tax=Mucilaginibacter agri TaxID=2695265 RepID=A0A966DTA2_9SPHI|nr:winged helix DNA-binding protein [Mucilaginibacter agri]NCD69112.1 winged helix DNA-binding protein [Mucilaginibacter agri]
MEASMNQTVELVRLWGIYEKDHTNATLDDFFRNQLAVKTKKERLAGLEGKLIPDINGKLVILLRRIGRFHIVYSNKALEGTELDQIEEFGILVTIHNMGNPIKSEAIYNNIIELSSGTNMLIRMIKRGLVTEYVDPDDKRVKRLKVTRKGEKTLDVAKDQVLKVAQMMVQDLNDDEKHLCMELLDPINRRYSGLYQKQKNKSFDEIFKENMQ